METRECWGIGEKDCRLLSVGNFFNLACPMSFLAEFFNVVHWYWLLLSAES